MVMYSQHSYSIISLKYTCNCVGNCSGACIIPWKLEPSRPWYEACWRWLLPTISVGHLLKITEPNFRPSYPDPWPRSIQKVASPFGSHRQNPKSIDLESRRSTFRILQNPRAPYEQPPSKEGRRRPGPRHRRRNDSWHNLRTSKAPELGGCQGI